MEKQAVCLPQRWQSQPEDRAGHTDCRKRTPDANGLDVSRAFGDLQQRGSPVGYEHQAVWYDRQEK